MSELPPGTLICDKVQRRSGSGNGIVRHKGKEYNIGEVDKAGMKVLFRRKSGTFQEPLIKEGDILNVEIKKGNQNRHAVVELDFGWNIVINNILVKGKLESPIDAKVRVDTLDSGSAFATSLFKEGDTGFIREVPKRNKNGDGIGELDTGNRLIIKDFAGFSDGKIKYEVIDIDGNSIIGRRIFSEGEKLVVTPDRVSSGTGYVDLENDVMIIEDVPENNNRVKIQIQEIGEKSIRAESLQSSSSRPTDESYTLQGDSIKNDVSKTNIGSSEEVLDKERESVDAKSDLDEGGDKSEGENKFEDDELREDKSDKDELDEGEVESESSENKSKTSQPEMERLRKRAEQASVEEVPKGEIQRSESVPSYSRSTKVKEYVKARANGYCEGCGNPAPFTSKTGEPYLHAHHINELSDGGSDTPDTVIALCPNCHYRVHHGKDGDEYNSKLEDKLNGIEG